MGKFKVGDRVRLENYSHGEFEVGAEAVVERVGGEHVWLVGDKSGFSHRASNLSLAPQTPWVPKVGDRVRLVENNGGRGEWGAKGDEGVVLDYVANSAGPCVRFTTGAQRGDYWWVVVEKLEPLPAAPHPATLTIEPGKFYKTRDGRKVGPMKWCRRSDMWATTDGFPDDHWYSQHNVHFAKKFINASFGGEHKDDLVAEWQEPAVSVQSAQVDALAEEYGPAKGAASNDNAPKFKVGDRVKFRDDYGTSARGKSATVIAVKRWGDDGVQVDLGGSGGISTERAADLRLIAAPTTPAIVALIENGTPAPSTTPKVHATEGEATAEALRLANLHKGQKFGVFVLSDTAEVAKPVYEHKWQNLAADGQKINAIKALKDLTGLHLKPAKDAVEYFIQYAA